MKTYVSNPVLNAIASLIIWQQSNNTFILSKDGKFLNSDGKEYKLNNSAKIKVAHPMDMKKSEIKKWQTYFIDNSLKQPFEQIWEPVYDIANIKKERYSGCSLPALKFFEKEEHGIETVGYKKYLRTENDWSFSFSLKDCELKYYISDNQISGTPDMDSVYFNLGDFKVNKPSRYANHIIYLLDKWTIEERIYKNDPLIKDALNGYTISQILNFIDMASAMDSLDCLSVLLEYKNTNYGDYDSTQLLILE